MRRVKKQYIVLGLGRFGASLAVSLCRMGHEVLAVDASPALVEEVSPHVTQAVQADAADEEALRALDVGSFDAAIVAIGTDIRASVLVAVLCKEMGVGYVAAKAVDELHAKVLRKVGVDRVIFPEREMGVRMARWLTTPNILDLAELSGEDRIAEILTPRPWLGRTLAEIDVRRQYGVSVIAIKRGERLMASPGGEECLQAEDVLLVLGKHSQLERIEDI